ncbi:hypothetical protein DRN67_02975 [Candidatus Micrarchaeota archaeon]|nr:MAG: hypothetical protein DRN67_02975 [Candidatus Micrarchaeota archaeon]
MEEKGGIKELEKKKIELIEEAKRLDRAIYGKDCEIKALEGVLKSKKPLPPPGKLKAEAEGLEFRIATEAYTLDHEKELLKKIKGKKELLRQAIDIARKRSRIRRLRESIEGIKRKREKIEGQIQIIKKEIVSKRREEEKKQFNQHRKKKKRAREMEKKAEHERYAGGMKELEIGDVVIIRKKGGSESEEN